MVCRRNDDSGASAVEFALLMPVFFAILFGIISYGWMLSFRQSISQAASEGARAIAVAPSGSTTTKTDAITAINKVLGSYNVTCTSTGTLTHNGDTVGTCTVPSTTSPCTGSATLQCATVVLNYSYRDHALIPSFPGLGVTLPSTLKFSTTVTTNS
jgi:Flp pilus assembly protein TadG